MTISVIMIDGGFRENVFGARYFTEQNMKNDEYEVIWVDFYNKVHPEVASNSKIRVITLDNSPDAIYHSSYCFNAGILEAQGDLIVIPDADQIVQPEFLYQLRTIHEKNKNLVVYAYRYDEEKPNLLENYSFEELGRKCVLKNPLNYGGCLSVRKKWLMEINGYEQHPIFASGFHANGLDMYTRFKNFGLAIKWEPSLVLYHPWHPFTRVSSDSYVLQKELIQWRSQNLQFMAFEGIISERNFQEFNVNDLFKSGDAIPLKTKLIKILKKKMRFG